MQSQHNPSSPETPSIPCNLCGSSRISVLSNRSRSGKPLRTVICTQCGLAWTDPRPHEPRHFYGELYRLDYKGAYQPKPKHILRAGKVALARARKIRRHLAEPKAVFDVGTGGGEFAYLLKRLGHDVRGIEPNRGYAGYSIAEYGLAVEVGFVQDLALPPGAFDLITVWHVLEHTEDPFGVLAKLRESLKPDGVLVVEVPNVEATCQSPKSSFHEAHLFSFNIPTLRALGERAGLREEESLLSEDGGNITTFFRSAPDRADSSGGPAIPGNCERIMKIVRSHTDLGHFACAAPYRRFFQRMARSLGEKRETAHFKGGRQLLDELYSAYEL